MYKIKRFSWFGLGGKKSEPSKPKYTDQEIRDKISEVSKLLPPEYKKMVQASNDIVKFKNAHDYEYLYCDIAFPDFYTYDIDDMAEELFEDRPSSNRVTIASLDSYDGNYLYYDLATKEWSWREHRSSMNNAGKLTMPLKSSIIRYEEYLRDQWLKDDYGWLSDGTDMDDFKEFTDFVISTLKKRL